MKIERKRKKMTRNDASAKASKLWRKWVSAKPAVGFNGYIQESRNQDEYQAYDLDVIHRSMLQEYRYIRIGKSRATPALISEVRGELIMLGKIRKALA